MGEFETDRVCRPWPVRLMSDKVHGVAMGLRSEVEWSLEINRPRNHKCEVLDHSIQQMRSRESQANDRSKKEQTI